MRNEHSSEYGTESGAFSLQHKQGFSLEIEGLTEEERIGLMGLLGLLGSDEL